jgi:uncharacterized membrane protein
MKKMGATFLVLTMVLASILGLFSAPVAADEGGEGSRLLTTPDGLSWADPVKITTNNVDDHYPTLVVDTGANSHILYHQNAQDFKYQKYQRPGKLVVKETHIVSASVASQHAGQGTANMQPTERIGIDGDENVHVVWSTGSMWGGTNQYQKFSNSGKPLSQVIDPSPTASTPQLPYLGVGKNNYAYIATEQEGGGEHGELTRIDKNFNTQMVDVKSQTEGVCLVVDQWNDDVVHYGARSWSGSGIYHAKFSADLQMTVSPHSIFESVGMGTGWSSPVPSLTTTPNGNVHWLFYESTNTPRTIWYGETDKNGNPLHGGTAFQVTTGGGDYGDIVGDGENNVYIIWGDINDGHVYYTKIIEGNEQASLQQEPIKISAGISGQSNFPQFGVDPDNGLHVVFRNNGDGDFEIYYRYAYTFGVELRMDPQEQAKMMFIHPQEIKMANLSVKNVGGQNDTMFLNISVDFMGHEGQGWDAWLDEDELELEPSGTELVKVFVKGPDFGNPNDFIEVSINATSARNPDKNDSIQFRVFLVVDHNIRMDCADNVHITMAGQETEFVCNVMNTGDVVEDIRLDIIDRPFDWEVYLSEDFFTDIQPDEVKKVSLFVEPPSSALADEVGSVTLKAYLQSQPAIKDLATVHTIVQPNIFIRMEVDQPQKYVDPGNATDYLLTIYNEGNMAGTVVIIIEIMSGVGDWNVYLDRTSVAVPNNGEAEITKTVIAPEDARAGTRLVVRVEASDEARTMKSEITTTTVVRQIHDMDVTVYPPEVSVRPGETANYEVTVQNNGNGPERLTFEEVAMEVGWTPEFKQDGVPIDEILLEPGQQQAYTVSLKVPGSEFAGMYTSTFKLQTDMGVEFPFDVNTRVLQIYAIDVTTTLSKQTGTPGKVVFFSLIVKNNGNGDDVIALTLEDKPVNWQHRFVMDDQDIEAVPLPPTKQAKVNLLITIPFVYDQETTEYSMTVVGTSEGRVTDKVKFVVDLLLPNLKITKVKYNPKKIVADNPVTIELLVSNEGNVPCENVTVRFYDGTVAGEQVLERLPPGANKTVVFTWLPKQGPHTLIYEIDPDNRIIEVNEEDNKLKDRVTVSSPSNILPGFEAGMLLLALVPVVLLMRRKRK